MKKWILGIFIGVLSQLVEAAIQVEVEPSSIHLGETFNLLLTQDGQDAGVPDLTALQSHYVILGTERHMSYSVINGQSQSKNQWIITLKPLKAGLFTIPSIKLGMDKSPPITINVEKSSSAQQDNTADVQEEVKLVTKVNESKPYVNQQVIYTVTLYNSRRLLDAQYQGAEVDNALLIPLGDVKRSEQILNNIPYVVEEQHYAIYPQKSGPLKIKSPRFNALVYEVNPQRVEVSDKTLNLEVQPIPKQYQGKVWLPSTEVILKEHYEHENQTVSQGSTLTRTVTLEATSIPAQLLPPLKFVEQEGLSIYPEKGTDHNLFKEGKLIGSTEYKITYLFNKAGEVVIPEQKLHWFNTATGQDEIAVLPPRSMKITSVSGASSKAENNIKPKPKSKPIAAADTSPSGQSSIWPLIAGLFALGWMSTLIIWVWQKNRPVSQKKNYKKALDELHKACRTSNPKQTRDALIKWASLNWPDVSILNLADLTALIRDPALKKHIQGLSQVLYKNEGKALWRGDELLKALTAVQGKKQRSKKKPAVLPPINPF